MRRPLLTLALAAAIASLPLGPVPRAKDESGERLPFEAAVSVRWGKGAGSEAFRRDLERALLQAMAERCFERVVPPGADPERSGADLLLDVVLSNVRDETVFDQTLAKALDPDDPDRGMGQTARFSVDVDAALRALSSGDVVLRRDLQGSAGRRPVTPGEDVQAYARSETIATIVRDLTKAMCGDKADRKVRSALAPASSGSKR